MILIFLARIKMDTTHSKYLNTQNHSSIGLMNPSEWSSFIGNIETGCRFSLPLSCNMRVSICDTNIIFRYYKDKDKINYIISNDDRRNIVKYLKKHNLYCRSPANLRFNL